MAEKAASKESTLIPPVPAEALAPALGSALGAALGASLGAVVGGAVGAGLLEPEQAAATIETMASPVIRTDLKVCIETG